MTTLTVYADASDNFVMSQSGFDDYDAGYAGTYAAARAGSGTPGKSIGSAIGASLLVGQITGNASGMGPQFDVYEAFLAFDTSSIDAGQTVSAATLTVTSQSDYSTTDFDIQARLYNWGAAVDTGDFVAGASITQTLLAHKNTNPFTANTAYSFTDDAFPANVNATGTTSLMLCSSRTVGNNAPTGNEYVYIKSADTTGTTSDPNLVVEYTAGGGTNRDANVALTGGGVATVTKTGQHYKVTTATGGGVATIIRSKNGVNSITTTGGGIVTVNGSGQRLSSVAATGGGVVTFAGTKGSSCTALLTGGGVLTVSVMKGATATVTATGGGIVTIDGLKQTADAKQTSIQITGGGVVTIQAEKGATVNVTATGGGRVTLDYTTTGTVVVAADAGGVARRRRKITMEPVDDWSYDDDLVLMLVALS